eukprot:CAMPEP_0173147660 /NCGR_PEP_ID=MMETSP1105-20130129/9264_1 /TAXON_ID=2985 /ORGANISM="Ochromonas sp., Strain BG-1" /LENGTH=307 /DNA_ID=CAMNT_0014062181 /DNA_START=256 /DNA_END=1179 /DNA_ORIENTATION=-
MKEKMVKRPKKDSVLVKHKKWLAELQRNKERAEEEFLDEMRRKEESQSKFQDEQKKLREYSRTLLHTKSSDLAESKNPETSDQYDKTSSNNNEPADSKTSLYSDAKDYKKGAALSKPAWALTEDTAEFASDAKKMKEDDDLLDFAKSLNYDKYISDMEVKLMMDRLRKRIEDLEKEVAVEDQREADAEMRAAKREMLELMGNAESSLKQNDEQRPDDVAINTAKALLDEDEGMQAVHSTKSVVQLLKTAKEKIATVRNSVKPEIKIDLEPKVINEPKIVFHEPNEGARLDGKNTISNLPYMHRNPAV